VGVIFQVVKMVTILGTLVTLPCLHGLHVSHHSHIVVGQEYGIPSDLQGSLVRAKRRRELLMYAHHP
jgi:hypothetical protein